MQSFPSAGQQLSCFGRRAAKDAFESTLSSSKSAWPTEGDPERLTPLCRPSLAPKFELPGDPRILSLGGAFSRQLDAALRSRGFEPALQELEAPPTERPSQLPTTLELFSKLNPMAIANELRFALGSSDGAELLIHVQADQYWDGQLLAEQYLSLEQALRRRMQVRALFREAMTHCPVVVITLDSVECWWDTAQKHYLNGPLPPALVEQYPGRFELEVLSPEKTTSAVLDLLELLHQANPTQRVLLAVSPIPLRTTFSGSDVVTASAYAQSALRAAVELASRRLPHVDYQPFLESTTLWRAPHLGTEDLPRVCQQLVAHSVDRMVQAYFPPLFLESLPRTDPGMPPELDPIGLSAQHQAAFLEVSQYTTAHPHKTIGGAKTRDPLILGTGTVSRFVRLSLQVESSFHLDSIEVFSPTGENLSLGKATLISSTFDDKEGYDGRGALLARKNGGCGFHTKRESNPWLVIDLGSAQLLDRIVIYNRAGEFAVRANSLMVEVSTDLSNWTLLFDNLHNIKAFKPNPPTAVERAFLHASVRDPEPARAYMKQLEKEGHGAEARHFMQLVNELVRPQGVALGPHGFKRTFDLRGEAGAKKVFSELAQLLGWINREFELPAFISSGTLLGIVRDGKLIGHDDDVDICYLSKEKDEASILQERARLFAFLRDKGCKVTHSGLAHYWCRTPGGLTLDIFTGYVEDGMCSLNPLGRRGVKLDDVLPLTAHQTHDVTLTLPCNPEPMLVLNYGPNWRTPDPLWTFDWSRARSEFGFLYTAQ